MSASPSASPEPVRQGQTAEEPPQELQEVENADSIFPAPNAAYKRFTNRNLELARILQVKGTIESEDLLDGEKVPDFGLATLLEPPNVDWIVEEGSWSCFGQEFYVSSVLRNP